MKSKVLFTITLLLSWSHSALAQTEQSAPETWPDTIIMPWQHLNIDRDLVTKSGKAFAGSQKNLANTIIPSNQSLDKLAPNNSEFPILQTVLMPMLGGTRGDTPIVVQPAWTMLQGHPLFMLIVSNSDDNTIISQTHYIITPTVLKEAERTRTQEKLFSTILSTMWSELKGRGFQRRPPGISIGLGNASVSARGNEIERNAANLLLAETLPNTYTMINPLSYELLTAVHRVWLKPDLFKRANRDITTRWIFDSSVYSKSFPTTVRLNIHASDGVFGQTMTTAWEEPVTFALGTANKLTLKLTSRLADLLKTESLALRLDENPRVVKIYGAWAYLDKGRAWGLQMNDRLVLSENQQKIKGHIVGYFGPELKLSSPRGWPVSEGAIMYVRKGQAEVSLGQEFQYDTMLTPTPWPPTGANAK